MYSNCLVVFISRDLFVLFYAQIRQEDLRAEKSFSTYTYFAVEVMTVIKCIPDDLLLLEEGLIPDYLLMLEDGKSRVP